MPFGATRFPDPVCSLAPAEAPWPACTSQAGFGSLNFKFDVWSTDAAQSLVPTPSCPLAVMHACRIVDHRLHMHPPPGNLECQTARQCRATQDESQISLAPPDLCRAARARRLVASPKLQEAKQPSMAALPWSKGLLLLLSWSRHELRSGLAKVLQITSLNTPSQALPRQI